MPGNPSDIIGSSIKYNINPYTNNYVYNYTAGYGGLGISSDYFAGTNAGIGGIKIAGGGGGPVYIDTSSGKKVTGVGSDGGGSYGVNKNLAINGGGACGIYPTDPPSKGGNGVIVIQYTQAGPPISKKAPSSNKCGISGGCGTLEGMNNFGKSNAENCSTSKPAWLPFPVDVENCQWCNDNTDKFIEEIKKNRSLFVTTPGPTPTIQPKSLFSILNQTISFTDGSNNTFTYKLYNNNTSLSNHIQYDVNQLDISMNDSSNIIWTRKINSSVQTNDYQGTHTSTGPYTFDYTTINNSKDNILVFYDCQKTHDSYYTPKLTVDNSGNCQISFSSTSEKISGTHIHVAKNNPDPAYNGFDATSIMDFFVRTYPMIHMGINNIPNSLNSHDTTIFTDFDSALTPQVLASEDITKLIADYYFALCTNMQKTKKYESIVSTNRSSDVFYEDNKQSSQQTYLNVINMSAGILIAIGYIYKILTNK